jgi:anti-sigma B factor antagonist
MEMQITDLTGGIKQVKLVGRLDLKGTNEIDNAFAFATSSGATPVLVDLSEVDFLASIGMRMLITNAKALARRGSKMVLYKPTPLVKDALVTAGFDELIPIFDEFDDATTALNPVVSE